MSADGYADSLARVEEVTAEQDAAVLGDELFAVAGLLGREASLRRAVTDPSATAEAKRQLVRTVFDTKLTDGTIDVVATAAGSRWSSASDFVDTIERLAVMSFVIAAEKNGHLNELEDELFRFGRVVASDPGLRDAITNNAVPAEHRQALVRGLLEGKVSPSTASLAVHMVSSRHRSIEAALDEYQKVAADRQQRVVAVVRSAIELSDDERDRLAAALANQYDRDIQLNLVVDPDVIGGIRVEIGDDVIDGTVAARLDDARRRITR
ncbi:MAG: F0F1 ATP synthase subunit delta [Propionibacteriales bacterium]|nr:F0F1 ATP synthase subunit delta [Propionibacteriales bacterium]